MTKDDKKILNLAENLFSISYLINNYIQKSYGEDAFYLRGTTRILYKNSGDLHYQISKLYENED